MDESVSTLTNGHSSFQSFSKESTPGSESGTEADDEHFLKGLPAPKVKLHKGLRGRNEALSATGSPLPSPSILDDTEPTSDPRRLRQKEDSRRLIDVLRRNKNTCRRITEVGIVAALACLVACNPRVSPLVASWRPGESQSLFLFGFKMLTYCRLAFTWPAVHWPAHSLPSPSHPLALPQTPTLSFDPYPPPFKLRPSSAVISSGYHNPRILSGSNRRTSCDPPESHPRVLIHSATTHTHNRPIRPIRLIALAGYLLATGSGCLES